MSLSANFPTIRPSLLLDFAGSERLDPRVTFTRASTATYYDSLGILRSAANNQPRFDYNPSTLVLNGLLIEEQRTNLALQSDWAGAVAGTPGTPPTSWTLGLSGGSIDSVTADSLSQNTLAFTVAANRHYLTQTVTVAASTTYTSSAILVSNTGLGVGQIATMLSAPVGSTLTYRINGVVAVSTDVPVAGDKVGAVLVTDVTAGTAAIRFGAGCLSNSTGTVAIKWPQVEAGAFATSYIPTEAAAATRAADNASMTGTNFSSWYNASEGTIYVEASVNTSGIASGIVGVDDGTNNNRFRLGNNGASSAQFLSVVSGAIQFSTTVSGATLGVFNKQVLAYATNNYAGSVNASTPFTQATALVPVVNKLTIGTAQGSNNINGHIRRISYYLTRLPNATLQALTS